MPAAYRGEGHSVLARPEHARQDLRGDADGLEAAYDAGLFTEFMEQRAPGHTVLDGKIYGKGLLDFKREIAARDGRAGLPRRPAGLRQARGAPGDGHLLRRGDRSSPSGTPSWPGEAAAGKRSPARGELERIAEVCRHVPAQPPRDFQEALQTYWFCHLAVITELNGWDSFSPGHLDQHLLPFYERDWPRARSRASRPASCWRLSSSSSTTIRRRPRSA